MGDTLERLAELIDPGAWDEADPDLARQRQSGARLKARALLRELRNAPDQSGRLLLIGAVASDDEAARLAWKTMIDAILEGRD
jgi:hypothetical protein